MTVVGTGALPTLIEGFTTASGMLANCGAAEVTIENLEFRPNTKAGFLADVGNSTLRDVLFKPGVSDGSAVGLNVAGGLTVCERCTFVDGGSPGVLVEGGELRMVDSEVRGMRVTENSQGGGLFAGDLGWGCSRSRIH